jgi:hypothetical protein
VKIYCVYNKPDFESLREEQRQLLDGNHNELISEDSEE